VTNLPDEYLLLCAQELMRRHHARAEALRKLGILEAA
jgi:hypothetical protein